MIGLIQRVSSAKVTVANNVVGSIDRGILMLLGIEKEDDKIKAERLIDRILGYRIFTDEHDKMNLSLSNIQGGLLIVPQFTLAADTRKGSRPGFSTAASPEKAKELFLYAVQYAQKTHDYVATGEFGADMKVSLTNDGPVTFWLQV